MQDQSGLQARGSAGIRYAVDDATTLRALALVDYDGADAKSLRSVEFGAGLSASYRYVSGFSFAPRPWILQASARLLRREYFEDDVVAAVRRQDTDLRLDRAHGVSDG